MNEKGHWYTDKMGNHYFVEAGQTPKEGWEASKRRKMINKGKYQTSEDGETWEDVDKEKYDAYEADEQDFDLNEDADFEYDEGVANSLYDEIEEVENEEEKAALEDKIRTAYADGKITIDEEKKILEKLFEDEDGDREYSDDAIMEYLKNYDYAGNETLEDVVTLAREYDPNITQRDAEIMAQQIIDSGRVRNGQHDNPERKYFDNPQEAREWVEEKEEENAFGEGVISPQSILGELRKMKDPSSDIADQEMKYMSEKISKLLREEEMETGEKYRNKKQFDLGELFDSSTDDLHNLGYRLMGLESEEDEKEPENLGPKAAKETWPPQDLKQYMHKTDNGYSFDMSIFKDKTLDEIMMALDHPDAENNFVIRNGIMSALKQKLKEQPGYGKVDRNESPVFDKARTSEKTDYNFTVAPTKFYKKIDNLDVDNPKQVAQIKRIAANYADDAEADINYEYDELTANRLKDTYAELASRISKLAEDTSDREFAEIASNIVKYSKQIKGK